MIEITMATEASNGMKIKEAEKIKIEKRKKEEES